ncbi:hypothetical protein EFS13_05110 [Lentilactobacillus buchneri]|nr:hypothetical protein [Lentilactobacillus buchneri]MCT2898354.1 hypothetical protein [Lentilactobacillus buchneri]MCT3253417.1 hypothetical protein [Lentilactobacillus buchneri]MCT3548009.1 hypothetical protein [Lentilactobacillus buchneri]MCT3554929.1 hypothetical protein [Lentilactobacillus buchneri]
MFDSPSKWIYKGCAACRCIFG